MANLKNQADTVFFAAATATAFVGGVLVTYWGHAKLAEVNPNMVKSFKDFAFAGLKKVLDDQK